MQFIVENEKFANALGLAKGCIRASTIPILAHIALSAKASVVTVRATNQEREIEAEVPAEVAIEAAIALPGEVLAGLVRRLPKGGELALALKGDRATIVSGTASFDLRTLPLVDFPEFRETPDDAVTFDVPCTDLKRLINETVYATYQGCEQKETEPVKLEPTVSLKKEKRRPPSCLRVPPKRRDAFPQGAQGGCAGWPARQVLLDRAQGQRPVLVERRQPERTVWCAIDRDRGRIRRAVVRDGGSAARRPFLMAPPASRVKRIVPDEDRQAVLSAALGLRSSPARRAPITLPQVSILAEVICHDHTTRYRVSVRVFAPGELPGKPRERGDTFRSVSVEGPCTMVVPDIGEMITMTRKEIENYLEELVKKGHARVVALTESGKKRYAMTEEGLFAGEPNVEYALWSKSKNGVIMALKHPIDTPAEGEEGALKSSSVAPRPVLKGRTQSRSGISFCTRSARRRLR